MRLNQNQSNVARVALSRLVRLLGSRLSGWLDMLPHQARAYPGWKTWLIVSRLKFIAFSVACGSSIRGAWRQSCRMYPVNSLRCLPLWACNLRSYPVRTSSNGKPRPDFGGQCQAGMHTGKAPIPFALQSETRRSQPRETHPQAPSPKPSFPANQEEHPLRPSQDQGLLSSSEKPLLYQCRPSCDVVSGENSEPNAQVEARRK